MRRRTWLSALILSVFALSACGPSDIAPTPTGVPTEPEATSLPTAVPPDESSGTWALPFEYAFPAGSWSEGVHRYGFLIDCAILEARFVGSEWQQLGVTDTAPVREAPVYLRMNGLSTGPLTPLDVEKIHPQQETIAVVTFVNLERDQALEAARSPDCEVVLRWDDKTTEVLEAGEPYQP
jgi:hypothetical protein